MKKDDLMFIVSIVAMGGIFSLTGFAMMNAMNKNDSFLSGPTLPSI